MSWRPSASYSVLELQLLDEDRHRAPVLGRDERDARARPARAAGAADAVGVGVGVVRRIEVDDVGDVVDVDAAGGDVGGDERLDAAAGELAEGALARRLRLVAVHDAGADAGALELLGQAVGAVTRADEHQRARRLAGEEVDERLDAVARDGHEAVRDRAGLLRTRDVLVTARLARVALGDVEDLARQRGGEEHRLPVGRDAVHDLVDLRLEAHVEHAVGLVEDEDLDALEAHGATAREVAEAARRGDDDLRLGDVPHLLAQRGAAVGAGDPEAAGAGDAGDLLGDLRGELAGRHEDQRGVRRGVGLEAVDDRDAEGEGLARAGRRLHQHVAAGERVGHDAGLDRERLGDAAALERCAHGVGHAEIGEGGTRQS